VLKWVQSNKWKASFFSLFILLAVALPYLLQHFTKQAIFNYTQAYGIQQVELEDIDLNLFTGVSNIHNLRLYQQATTAPKDQEPIIEVGHLSVEINLPGLLQQRIWIESLVFKDAQLPFTLDNTKQLYLAGIPLLPQTNSDNKPETPPPTFLPGLDKISVDNVQISLDYLDKKTVLNIQELSLEHLYTWSEKNTYPDSIVTPDFARLKLRAKLNKTSIQTNLQLHLFSEEPKVVGTLQTVGFNTNDYLHIIPKQNFDFNAMVNSDITFTLQQSQQGLKLFQQGNIAVIRPSFVQDDTKAKLQNLSWKGDVHYIEYPTSTIDLNGKLQVHGADLKQPPYSASLKQASLNGKMSLVLDDVISIKANEKLTVLGLSFTDSDTQQSLTSDLSASMNSHVNIEKGKVQLNHTGNLSINKLKGHYQDVMAELQQLQWQGKLNFTSNQTLAFDSIGSINLNHFKVNSHNLTLAQLESAKVEQLELKNTNSIAVQNIMLKQLVIAQPNQQPGLTTLKTLALDSATYTKHDKHGKNTMIDLGTLSIHGSETHLTFTKDGKIKQVSTLLDALQTKAKDKKATSTKPAELKEEKPFHYQLAALKIQGKNPVHIVSEQFNHALKKTLKLENFVLGTINSKTPLKHSLYDMKIGFDEFSHLSSKGTFTPLKPSKHFTASTKIEGLSLIEFSSLAEQSVGYQIQSGQLSAELETHLTDNTVNAQNKLQLHKLELESIDNAKAKTLQKDFPIPLETGLAMLQDKNDNIELSLPIKGDLNSPDFNINDVISLALGKALAGATRTYLLLALQPFGAIALAGEYALDQASAITLQPVAFKSGSQKLTSKMQAYLAKIHTILSERQAIQIKLCGGVSEADRKALKKAAIRSSIEKQAQRNGDDPDKPSKEASKITVPDIQISNKQLLTLASERQKAIKRYLIKLGASSKQIVICKPVISKETKTTQVNITI